MKEIYIILTALTLPFMADAQEEVTDSIADRSVELDEVVIAAPKVVRKADMDVYFPSKSAIDNAKNGMQVLRNLMIPTLTVNDALGEIKTAGQTVQVRINGREASIEQVRTLLPETIKRVEWTDTPGLRYKGADGVINFIVVNPTAGGSLMTQAMPSLNKAWGQYYAALKLNNGRSQWGLDGHYKMTNKISSHRDYHETFTTPDGQSITRTEKPLGGYVDNSDAHLQLTYSYINPDKTTVWAAVHGHKAWPEATNYNGRMSLSTGANDILLHEYNSTDGFTPSFAAYIEQHFSSNRILVIDFNGRFYNGHSRHEYTERDADDEKVVLTDVNTSIKDRNQAYGIEADYITKWKNSKLTAGVQYTANRNRSTYENLGGAIFHQRQDRVYFFGEYFHRIDKVTLTAGLGAQYTSFRFRESGEGNHSWNLRPQFTVTYRPDDKSQFKLNFRSWQSAPSLAETNVTPQQIDGFQWRVGNPGLKTSTSYMLTLNYNYTFKRIMGTFGVRAFTSPDAITPFFSWHDDKLVTSYENSRGLQNLTFWVGPQIEVVPGWLMLSGTLQYRAERMRGTDYRHYNHDWSGSAVMELSHWGFSLMGTYQREQKDLWGETVSWGENFSIVTLSYNLKNWELTAGMILPFGRYDKGSRTLSKWNSNETHMRIDMSRMPFLQISYNFQWGRQKRGAEKLINVDADVDQSSAKGR